MLLDFNGQNGRETPHGTQSFVNWRNTVVRTETVSQHSSEVSFQESVVPCYIISLLLYDIGEVPTKYPANPALGRWVSTQVR